MSTPEKQRVSAKKLRAICERLKTEYRDDPNIVGVGIGPKLVKGKRKGVAIQVSVRIKAANDEELKKLDTCRVPKKVDGIPVDVIPVGTGKPSAAPTGARGGRQEDPLVGGTSTTVLSDFHSFPTGYGTLGGICFDTDTGNAMGISNAHVWGEDLGRTVIQPWMPVDEYVESAVKLIACGAAISYLADWTAPSPLTGILAAGAAGAWAAAAASDEADPSRWGQGETPVANAVMTDAERVSLAGEVPENPMPGYPYVAKTKWDYTRLSDDGDKAASIEEDRLNRHVAVKRVITERQQYRGGERVRICAEVLGFGALRALDYFVVARAFPLADPDRAVTRVLRPGACDFKRPDEWECFRNFPRTWLKEDLAFPLRFGVFEFSGTGDPVVRAIQVNNQPGAQIALRIPFDGGLTVNILPTSQVRVDVSHTFLPVTVFARDPIGRVVDQKTSINNQRERETLELTGQMIQSLTVFGGGGEGWLHGICVSRPELPDDDKLPDLFKTFTFVGDLDLGLREASDRWGIIVTVQTVDNSPPGTPPVDAAQNIGGLMTAPVTAQLAGCVTVMLLDHVFDVI